MNVTVITHSSLIYLPCRGKTAFCTRCNGTPPKPIQLSVDSLTRSVFMDITTTTVLWAWCHNLAVHVINTDIKCQTTWQRYLYRKYFASFLAFLADVWVNWYSSLRRYSLYQIIIKVSLFDCLRTQLILKSFTAMWVVHHPDSCFYTMMKVRGWDGLFMSKTLLWRFILSE